MTWTVEAQLKTGFYSSSCPKAEGIVRSTVESHFKKDPTIAPALLRLQFHDCFVQVTFLSIKPFKNGTINLKHTILNIKIAQHIINYELVTFDFD